VWTAVACTFPETRCDMGFELVKVLVLQGIMRQLTIHYPSGKPLSRRVLHHSDDPLITPLANPLELPTAAREARRDQARHGPGRFAGPRRVTNLLSCQVNIWLQFPGVEGFLGFLRVRHLLRGVADE